MSGLQMIYTVVLKEPYVNRGSQKTLAGKYDCHKLVYYEGYESAYEAMSREKQIKKWRRAKKENYFRR